MTNAFIDAGASFSGLERDHLFVNQRGKKFVELSGVSGLDSPGDARTHVRWDFNRDGFTDIALVNANAPFLQLFRNRTGKTAANRFVALRLYGGNRTGSESSWSARDGIGAQVRAKVGERTLLRELRAGEGFAGQNSKTMLVGLGEHDQADQVEIRWPSGRVQSVGQLPAGMLVEVYEDAKQGPNQKAVRIGPYRGRQVSPLAQRPSSNDFPMKVDRDAELSVYITMATWCDTCARELARLEENLRSLSPGDVAAYTIPIDPDDTPTKLDQWLAKHRQTSVSLIRDLTAGQRRQLGSIFQQHLASPQAVPNTIVTDRQGKVRAVYSGAPTLSQLRAMLDRW